MAFADLALSNPDVIILVSRCYSHTLRGGGEGSRPDGVHFVEICSCVFRMNPRITWTLNQLML